jgi:glycosyltransferase involved in cell wall biosynthesis
MSQISIIIPAHNEEKYIAQTIGSLLKQTYKNFEIIVVPNGCTDTTETKVQKILRVKNKFISNRTVLMTIPIKEANVSKARNFGAKIANGEILLFLDADTTLEKNALLKIEKEFNKKISFATTKVRGDKKGITSLIYSVWKNFFHKTGLYKGTSGTLISWKKQFEKVGGFNEKKKIMEIKDLRKKLLKFGKYKFINTTAITSMRRFSEWGIFGTLIFWIKALIKKVEKTYEVIR